MEGVGSLYPVGRSWPRTEIRIVSFKVTAKDIEVSHQSTLHLISSGVERHPDSRLQLES